MCCRVLWHHNSCEPCPVRRQLEHCVAADPHSVQPTCTVVSPCCKRAWLVALDFEGQCRGAKHCAETDKRSSCTRSACALLTPAAATRVAPVPVNRIHLANSSGLVSRISALNAAVLYSADTGLITARIWTGRPPSTKPAELRERPSATSQHPNTLTAALDTPNLPPTAHSAEAGRLWSPTT